MEYEDIFVVAMDELWARDPGNSKKVDVINEIADSMNIDDEETVSRLTEDLLSNY